MLSCRIRYFVHPSQYSYLCAFLLLVIVILFFLLPKPSSKSQSCTVSRPSVVAQHLSAAHLAFAKVLGNSAADLREGGSHDFSEVSLWMWLVQCR
jgi:hypothetical protein